MAESDTPPGGDAFAGDDRLRHLFRQIEDAPTVAESQLTAQLVTLADLSDASRAEICRQAEGWVREIRNDAAPGLVEVVLTEYGLSNDEGIALMCLAEALLRVPDSETIDALIEDKIASSDWSSHLGGSASAMVNATTWALMLTGKVLQETPAGMVGHLRNIVRRLGEPVVRIAVAQAIRAIGQQFILGSTIDEALAQAKAQEAQGYVYSYDMLGEAALTEADADHYYLCYCRAITAIADSAHQRDIADNPGISVKLSALHPRFCQAQRERVMDEAVPRLRALALLAKSANVGLCVDAEESARLCLSLEVIAATLADSALEDWDGFGVAVQAYGKGAIPLLDWLYHLAASLHRNITVRLVKGAYWDSEIKIAQTKGLGEFPVFTQKAASDMCYIACARRLLQMSDRIYPQFATHNAHTIAAVMHLAAKGDAPFEWQRLHGMGEAMHEAVHRETKRRCRIYAPVGDHRDLLSYLVRRLLENGANSSFVNQLRDSEITPAQLAQDPFAQLNAPRGAIATGADLFRGQRENSRGFDIDSRPTWRAIERARGQYRDCRWRAQSLTVDEHAPSSTEAVYNPSAPNEQVGQVAPLPCAMSITRFLAPPFGMSISPSAGGY